MQLPTSHVKFHGVRDVSFGRLPSFNICFLFLLPLQALGCAERAGLEVCVLISCMLMGLFFVAEGGNVTMLLHE